MNPQLPVASVRELVAAAKAQLGKIDFASSGNGSAQHLVAALFNTMAAVELNHVPYKGSGPAMQDLLSGQVSVSFAGTPKRSPDVPTIAEAGVPGYEATLWLGLAAPAGVPAEIVQRLNTDISKLLREPDVQQGFRAAGVDASVLGPAEFGAFMRTELEKWGKVVRDTGATVN